MNIKAQKLCIVMLYTKYAPINSSVNTSVLISAIQIRDVLEQKNMQLNIEHANSNPSTIVSWLI